MASVTIYPPSVFVSGVGVAPNIIIENPTNITILSPIALGESVGLSAEIVVETNIIASTGIGVGFALPINVVIVDMIELMISLFREYELEFSTVREYMVEKV